MVGFAVVNDEVTAADSLLTRVSNELAYHLTAYRSDASMVTTDRTIYVLLPAANAAAASRFADGALKALDRAFPGSVRLGIATSSSDVTLLPAMRSEVDGVLCVLTARRGRSAIASISDVRLDVLLGHIADAIEHDPALRHPGVDAMVRHDREHASHYAVSLLAWIEALGDVAAAARMLDVHANTLRYRLRRIEQNFSILVSDNDVPLAAWLQLRADASEVSAELV